MPVIFEETKAKAKLYRPFGNCCLLFFSVFLSVVMVTAQSDRDTQTLEFQKSIERELAGRQSHSYRIRLTAGQYFHVVVDQRGIDVIVTLFATDGKQIAQIDSPNGAYGPEPVLGIAETSGTYRLEVRALETYASAGRYEVKIEELRPSVKQDKIRIAIERELLQAQLLSLEGTAESQQRALKRFEEVLPLIRDGGDRSREAVVLHNISGIYYSLGNQSQALVALIQALALYRGVGARSGEATTLNDIGTVYATLSESQKAINYYQEALRLSREIRDRSREATIFSNLGAVYYSMGDNLRAMDHYEQALALDRAAGNRLTEAGTLNNLGAVYNSAGEKQKALDNFNRVLELVRAESDPHLEALALHSIGNIYAELGLAQKALEYYLQALPLSRSTRDRQGQARNLTSIGTAYESLGESMKALDYYNIALPLFREMRDLRNEARTLGNLGAVYANLGEKQKALVLYNHALPLLQTSGDRGGEAKLRTSIGLIYDGLGQNLKALDYFNTALALYRSVGDRVGEAATLNNIGAVYNSSGEKNRALDYFGQALAISTVENRSGKAAAINHVGPLSPTSGARQKALDLVQALPLLRVIGDRDGEAKKLDNLMSVYQSLSNPRFAIFFGKQAVSVYQQHRATIRDFEAQKNFLKSVEPTYRGLADALITQGRFAEAQEVLNAFKDQQFFDFDQNNPQQPLALTRSKREDELGLRLDKLVTDLGAIDAQIAELRAKLDGRQPEQDEAEQLQLLETRIKNRSADYSSLLKQAEAEFSQPIDEKDRIEEIHTARDLQATLRELARDTGQSTVAIYTLVGPKHFYALVVTPDGITPVSSTIDGDELNKKATFLWALLQSADYDPRILSRELYTSIFKPIEEKLPMDTKTIMWFLDGNLRYLPMAALYDGKQYLVERYNHAVFTRPARETLTRAVSPNWTGFGFATSGSHEVRYLRAAFNFAPTEFARDEMQIFRTKSHPGGIIEGDVYSELEFSKASFLAALKQRRPLIHISSHYQLQPGDAAHSFLLLGDDQVMTLAELREHPRLFQGIELLTLSACNTAAQRPDAADREIDTLADLAQRLGADAVLASLWAVLDRSTAQLMKGFYVRRQGGRFTKANSLREAQLDLLYGKTESAPLFRGGATDVNLVVDKKYRIPFKIDKKKPFAHPYYWSPFILLGNWK